MSISRWEAATKVCALDFQNLAFTKGKKPSGPDSIACHLGARRILPSGCYPRRGWCMPVWQGIMRLRSRLGRRNRWWGFSWRKSGMMKAKSGKLKSFLFPFFGVFSNRCKNRQKFPGFSKKWTWSVCFEMRRLFDKLQPKFRFRCFFGGYSNFINEIISWNTTVRLFSL